MGKQDRAVNVLPLFAVTVFGNAPAQKYCSWRAIAVQITLPLQLVMNPAPLSPCPIPTRSPAAVRRMNSPHSQYIKQQQRESSNLTTCDHSSTPYRLLEFSYPINDNGPIPASNLRDYILTHDCPFPRCMCNLPCHIFEVKSGDYRGNHAIACPNTKLPCRFWYLIEDVLKLPGISYHSYPARNVSPIPSASTSTNPGVTASRAATKRKSRSRGKGKLKRVRTRSPTIGNDIDDDIGDPTISSDAFVSKLRQCTAEAESPLTPVLSSPATNIPESRFPTAISTPSAAPVTPRPANQWEAPLPSNTSPILVSSRGPSPPILIPSSPSPAASLPSHLQSVYRQLTSSAGLKVATFHEVWKECKGCQHMVPRHGWKDHRCDLTMMEMD